LDQLKVFFVQTKSDISLVKSKKEKNIDFFFYLLNNVKRGNLKY